MWAANDAKLSERGSLIGCAQPPRDFSQLPGSCSQQRQLPPAVVGAQRRFNLGATVGRRCQGLGVWLSRASSHPLDKERVNLQRAGAIGRIGRIQQASRQQCAHRKQLHEGARNFRRADFQFCPQQPSILLELSWLFCLLQHLLTHLHRLGQQTQPKLPTHTTADNQLLYVSSPSELWSHGFLLECSIKTRACLRRTNSPPVQSTQSTTPSHTQHKHPPPITMPLSESSGVQLAAHAFATIFTGFGVNAILRPTHALTFFEFAPPASPAEAKMVESLMAVYGARDIFMGLAIYAAALFGTSKSLGLTLIAASGVAVVDGVVCFTHGQGQWNHWGYAPMITAVGVMLLGMFDGAKKA